MSPIFLVLLLGMCSTPATQQENADALFFEAYYLVHAHQDEAAAAKLLKGYLASGQGQKIAEAGRLLASLNATLPVKGSTPSSTDGVESAPLDLSTLFPTERANQEFTKAFRDGDASQRELAAGRPFEAARLRTRHICWQASQLILAQTSRLTAKIQQLEAELKLAERIGDDRKIESIRKGIERTKADQEKLRVRGWRDQVKDSSSRLKRAYDFLFLFVDLNMERQIAALPEEMRKSMLKLRDQRRLAFHSLVLGKTALIKTWQQSSEELARIDPLLLQLDALELALIEKRYIDAQRLANEAFRSVVK